MTQPNSPALFKICSLANGGLWVMPKPCSEKLHKDIEHYKNQGIDKVLSLLLPEEIKKLQMQQEAQACLRQDIEFQLFSIKDMSVPAKSALKNLNQQLKQDLIAGKQLAIHCHGGRGRAGIVAITLMMEHGIDAQQALAMAQQARGDKMPVTDQQTDFVLNYLND